MNDDSLHASSVLADINVTPMVDVMLVLLVIFMIVTPALLAGFQGQLPQGIHLKERQDDPGRVELGIDANGRYYLNKRPIQREDAAALLQQEFLRRPQDRVLFVRADRRLRYREILDAMELARGAGARVIAAVTEHSPDTTPTESARR